MYQFAQTIRKFLRKKKWNVPRFASEIGRSTEHARKLYNGTATPSSELAEAIARRLQIPTDEKFLEQVDRARFERRYHRKPPSGEYEDLVPLSRVWNELSGDQQEYLLCFANCLAERKRQHEK